MATLSTGDLRALANRILEDAYDTAAFIDDARSDLRDAANVIDDLRSDATGWRKHAIEADWLRALIRSAPHEINDLSRGKKACATWRGEECDCWKADAL